MRYMFRKHLRVYCWSCLIFVNVTTTLKLYTDNFELMVQAWAVTHQAFNNRQGVMVNSTNK